MLPRQGRAVAIAEAAGASCLVLAGPAAVPWLTGHIPEIETGPSPFQLPAIAVLGPGRTPILVVSEDEADAAAKTGCEVVSYPGFGVGPVDPVGAAGRALAVALDGTTRVAIDAGMFPAALTCGLDWADVGRELDEARAVKDPDEIVLVRQAIAVCDAGQAAARTHAAPGMTELDLWAETRAAMERAAGGRLPVLADLVSGSRTCDVGGPPGMRKIEEGDLVLCDLVPRVAGYWGDSCSTFAVGEPGSAAQAVQATVRETLETLVGAIRPGAVAGELDALARSALDFPHHTGHGLGTAWHEAPRLVPRSETVLEEGMVVALEPGSYGEVGLRLEQVLLVTADGCELLSGHALDL